MHEHMRGFRIHFQVNGVRDILIIPFGGVETEEQARGIAVLAARHGYPDGAIDITRIDAGTWCPTGYWGNPEHTAIYAQ